MVKINIDEDDLHYITYTMPVTALPLHYSLESDVLKKISPQKEAASLF
jgi:hypothetical protein